jgi:hypothetical protein
VQGEIVAKIKALKLELKKSGGQQLTTDGFLIPYGDTQGANSHAAHGYGAH